MSNENRRTLVVCFYGGPCVGKTVSAMELAVRAKKRNEDCEYVSEVAREWASEGRPIGPLHQPTILGEQTLRESRFYGSVDTLYTDSPILLSPMYLEMKHDKNYLYPSTLAFMDHAKELKGVEYLHLFVTRGDLRYDKRRRFEQTRDEASINDAFIFDALSKLGIDFKMIERSSNGAVDQADDERCLRLMEDFVREAKEKLLPNKNG